ncbi:MAG: tRNA (adenosine(37)-N6)-dimethylallyltransferase MiaA [Candidatus Beckwithbacteria bacterium]|nr:tRNA (adenosine(37)-N6)-dimethylallyltransferase MiaA [Patescibacteria group bacterium]
MKKLLIICGPTATGKTDLGLKLAKKFNGQLISVDSRQVYKGMNIGTGKDLPKNVKQHQGGHYLVKGIKLWGYDLVNPDQEFSLAHFIKFVKPLIKKIYKQNQLPIIVGGTGLYLKAITGKLDTTHIPPNQPLRRKLGGLSIQELGGILRKVNSIRFDFMNHSDQQNSRRLIRAIEIAKSNHPQGLQGDSLKFILDQLWIGLKADKKILDIRIKKRVDQRLKAGAQKEVKKLIKAGYSFNLPSMSAMGYKQWQLFFNKNHNIDQVRFAWNLAEKQYLRRQLTWFNKNKKINWFDITTKDCYAKVVRKVTLWYTIN